MVATGPSQGFARYFLAAYATSRSRSPAGGSAMSRPIFPRANASTLPDDGDQLHFCSTCAFSQACLSQGLDKGRLMDRHMLVEHVGPFHEGEHLFREGDAFDAIAAVRAGTVKTVHVATVIASGALFLLRGILVQAGTQRVATSRPLRYASYAIDTVLLTAALMLVSILPGAMFANHWLTLKLVLLVAYVVLGSLALKRGRTPRARTVAFVAALATYATMLGIARAHHPLGWLHAFAA
jgi:uncharacterized membrane protein SirB2